MLLCKAGLEDEGRFAIGGDCYFVMLVRSNDGVDITVMVSDVIRNINGTIGIIIGRNEADSVIRVVKKDGIVYVATERILNDFGAFRDLRNVAVKAVLFDSVAIFSDEAHSEKHVSDRNGNGLVFIHTHDCYDDYGY